MMLLAAFSVPLRRHAMRFLAIASLTGSFSGPAYANEAQEIADDVDHRTGVVLLGAAAYGIGPELELGRRVAFVARARYRRFWIASPVSPSTAVSTTTNATFSSPGFQPVPACV